MTYALKLVLYAGDTNVFCSGGDLHELLGRITTEMCKLKMWFDRNKLSLNLSKTKFMLFSNHNKNTQVQIQVNGVDIDRVYENKFLGVIIDDKINWKSHIKHIQSKLSRSISVLSKAKPQITPHSLLLPYLHYCAEVCGNIYKCAIQPLSIPQERPIRIIHNTGYRDHTNSLF